MPKVRALVAGHAFQQHAETLPDEHWDKLLSNPEALVELEAGMNLATGEEAKMWDKVRAIIAKKKAERAS
jgi:hypothetical protein